MLIETAKDGRGHLIDLKYYNDNSFGTLLTGRFIGDVMAA